MNALRWIFSDDYGIRAGWMAFFLVAGFALILASILSINDSTHATRLDSGCFTVEYEKVDFPFNTVEKTSGVYCQVQR